MAELTDWKDPALTIPVAFAPEALERIRRLTVEGLLSLRRVGMGVGGLLLGRYAGAKVSILGVREIECGHKFGPSFRLTTEEIAAAAETVAADGGLRVVGLYCSKPRAAAQLSDDDRGLFDVLCPERWQVALVVSPSSNDASAGAMYVRGRGGAVAGGTLLPIVQFSVAPAAPEPEPVPEPQPEAEPLPQLVSERVREPVPAPQPLTASHPMFVERPEIPVFAPVNPARRSKVKPLLTGAVAGIVFVALCIAAFLGRELWMPRPKPDLRSYDSNGQLTIEWNRSAVRGIDNGSLLVSDGTDTRTIALSATELHSGSFRYQRKTGRVSVVLRAGQVQDATAFKLVGPLAPAPPVPGQP